MRRFPRKFKSTNEMPSTELNPKVEFKRLQLNSVQKLNWSDANWTRMKTSIEVTSTQLSWIQVTLIELSGIEVTTIELSWKVPLKWPQLNSLEKLNSSDFNWNQFKSWIEVPTTELSRKSSIQLTWTALNRKVQLNWPQLNSVEQLNWRDFNWTQLNWSDFKWTQLNSSDFDWTQFKNSIQVPATELSWRVQLKWLQLN